MNENELEIGKIYVPICADSIINCEVIILYIGKKYVFVSGVNDGYVRIYGIDSFLTNYKRKDGAEFFEFITQDKDLIKKILELARELEKNYD